MKSYSNKPRHSFQSNSSHRDFKFGHRTLAPLESLQMISSSRNKFLIGVSSPSFQKSSDQKLLTFGLKDNNSYKNLRTTNCSSKVNSHKGLNLRETEHIVDSQQISLLKRSNPGCGGGKEEVRKRNYSARRSKCVETLEDDGNLEQGVIPRNQSVQQAMGHRPHSEESERNINIIEPHQDTLLNSEVENVHNQYRKPAYYANWMRRKKIKILNGNNNASKDRNVVMLNEIKTIQKEVLERKYRLKYGMNEKEKNIMHKPIYIETIDSNIIEEHKECKQSSDSIVHDFRPNIAKLPQSKVMHSYNRPKEKSNALIHKNYNEVEVQVMDNMPKVEIGDKIMLDGSINHENVSESIKNRVIVAIRGNVLI